MRRRSSARGRSASVVIHGHFYQPPRENPWLEEVETEASATPFHDWNERIEHECYRAVAAARVLGHDGRIDRIVNTLEWISFNFGPTLLEWMERAAPDTYAAVVDADARSAKRLNGHGNAIAQPYHHTILPLATRRDKETEVRWGIADFRRRFGRDPEGMWLPETAVDDETLDVLAAEGIRFTILAPRQVKTPPPNGVPGRYTTSNGRTIALCPYDGDLAHGIAFGSLTRDARTWVDVMLERIRDAEPGGDPPLVSVATDGETYGHHHRFGDMALAAAVATMSETPGVAVENFASYLAAHPASEEVELVEPTSWSCAHGVERWRSNCGCRISAGEFPDQSWRSPLRVGLAELAQGLHAIFEREGQEHWPDPWVARDAYAAGNAEIAREVRAAELLEMERGALRMFTSCAWFFDDIGGLEPLQVLRYARRAIELAGPAGDVLENALVATLAKAKSNDPKVGTGRDVYLTTAVPAVPQLARVAAGAAAMLRVAPEDEYVAPASCVVSVDGERVTVEERRTGRVERFRVVVGEATPHDVAVEVHGSETWRFRLVDLPERDRAVLARRLRRGLAEEVLSADDLALVSRGDATLASIASSALARAIGGLAVDAPDGAIERVVGLLDLVELLGEPIPFDAQTMFYRVREWAKNDDRARFDEIGRRLGFSSSTAQRT
jgi:hypothetical protein